MHLLGGETDGQTPLDPDEADGLLRTTITTLGELDEVEQENIAKAIPWALRTARGAADVLTETFLRDLHRRMYGDVWRWAGMYRRSNKNIGVDWWQVPSEIAALISDGLYWLEHGTFLPEELCVRFKHRLVSHIHPFPNGNGRHSRLVADALAVSLGEQPFTWGQRLELAPGELRRRYLDGLRSADAGDIAPLLAFARA